MAFSINEKMNNKNIKDDLIIYFKHLNNTTKVN